ncbi:MAG: hypothetical protein JW806_09510 [Sedimentisphaerales bacterium]|nr:hypothetical protein [Sedimentisphaerales bacterium]
MAKYLLTVVLITMTILAAGCATGKSSARTDYDFTKISKVAVIDVVGPVGSEGAKNQIGDMLAMRLLEKGFSPIERSQVQTLLKEQEFQASGQTSEEDAVQAGKILNVPIVIIINIPQFEENISMTIKMLDVEDGSILWLGSGSGTTGKTLGTILGAAGGAAAGIMIGGDDSSDKTAGGVIGGVLGGATANLLAPQKAQATEKIINKVCKDMPGRIPETKKKLLDW